MSTLEEHECEWCDSLAAFELVADWHSFLACEAHDVPLSEDPVAHGVIIHEIVDRR
ncbi:hypothetical protein K0651_03620 [Ornithinimicrobium sp. Arc0846-15]|nr:hypothetical protein [Ornithinimicrobium laminariae]